MKEANAEERVTTPIRDRLREILEEQWDDRSPESFARWLDRQCDTVLALFAEGERERDDLIADLFAQGASGSEDAAYPMDDSCISTYEDAARHLVAIGRLERHPNKRRYRWVDAAKEDR